jgi:hypothetical protein
MPLFAESNQLILLFIAALIVVTWMLMMRSHRYLARQRAKEPENWDTKPAPKTPAAYGELPETIARWEVEMHESTRQMSAQMDCKMSALQALIADADRAASRLEAAISGKPQLSPPQATESLKLPSEARREEVYTLADYGFSAADIASRIGAPAGEVEAILSSRGKK